VGLLSRWRRANEDESDGNCSRRESPSFIECSEVFLGGVLEEMASIYRGGKDWRSIGFL
jgi:hypothetical protein